MISYNNIFIKNIYYMLSYAFKALQQNNYEEIESENFENIYDLFAEIIHKGVNRQLKQGLYKEYITQQEDLPTIRGKIVLRDSIHNKIQRKQLMACEYDELSEDNLFNQILKAATILLIKEVAVKKERKRKLQKILFHFSSISTIDPRQINWNSLQFQRNNQTYQMLLNLCRFIIEGLLLTTESGVYKLPTFSEENLALLFERFVFEYYQKHYPNLRPRAPFITWNTYNQDDYQGKFLLPQMKTDIVLYNRNDVLIIDTKFYSNNLSIFNKIHSANLYQIYSYVKNEDVESSGNVSGMLLYAQTDTQQPLDYTYNMDGNLISVKSVDLNQEFEVIRKQLDEVVSFFRRNYIKS